MSEVSHPLIHPVNFTLGGEPQSIDTVRVRRIKGKDLRATAHLVDETQMGLKMIERLTGLDPLIVDELDAEDIEALGAIIEGFTKPGPKTGSAV